MGDKYNAVITSVRKEQRDFTRSAELTTHSVASSTKKRLSTGFYWRQKYLVELLVLFCIGKSVQYDFLLWSKQYLEREKASLLQKLVSYTVDYTVSTWRRRATQETG